MQRYKKFSDLRDIAALFDDNSLIRSIFAT